MKLDGALFGLVMMAAATMVLGMPERVDGFNPSHPCAFCHTSHGAPGTELIRGRDIEALCFSCHDSRGSSRLKVGSGHQPLDPNLGPDQKPCIGCHTPHGEPPGFLEPGPGRKPNFDTW